MARGRVIPWAALAFLVVLVPPAIAQKGPAAMLPGAGSHEPIKIDAGKLDYFDKEQKLVYTGNVVAVQGESTLKASQLIILLTKTAQKGNATAPGGAETAAASTAAAPGTGSSVSRMDAVGPVTLVSKDQIGTGDNASYDKDKNVVTMTGNVTLSQGPNVTRGDKLVYDLTTGQAQVVGGRVSSIFTPGSSEPGQAGKAADSKKTAPKTKASTAKK